MEKLPGRDGNVFPAREVGSIHSAEKALFLTLSWPEAGWHVGCGRKAWEETQMKPLTIVGAVLLVLGPLGSSPARAADDSKMSQGAKQVGSGGKQIGQGVADTAKGVGKTVVGGAEVAGDKIKEAGEAAKPKATNAWESV